MVTQTPHRRESRRPKKKTFYVDELEWLLGELGTVRPASVKETLPIAEERWPADDPAPERRKKEKIPASASPVSEPALTSPPRMSPYPASSPPPPPKSDVLPPLELDGPEAAPAVVTASDDEVSQCSSLTTSVNKEKRPAASSIFPPNSTAKVTEVREGAGFSVILADSVNDSLEEIQESDGRSFEVVLDPRDDWGLQLVALAWLQNSSGGKKIPLRRVGVLSAAPGNGIQAGDRVVSVNGVEVPRNEQFFDVCVDQLRLAKQSLRPVVVGLFRRSEDDLDDRLEIGSREDWRWKVIAFERWISFARDVRSGQRLSLAGASCSARALKRRRLLRLRSAFGFFVDRTRRQRLIEKSIVRSIQRKFLRSWQQSTLEMRALDEAATLAAAKARRRAFSVWQLNARLVRTRRKAVARLLVRRSIRQWRDGRNYLVQRFDILRNTYLRFALRNALREWRSRVLQIRAYHAFLALSTKRQALQGLRTWHSNVRQRAALERLSRRRGLREWRFRVSQIRSHTFFTSCRRLKTIRALRTWRANVRQRAALETMCLRRALREWRHSVDRIRSGRALLALCEKRESLRALRTWRTNLRQRAALETLCRRRALRAWRARILETKALIRLSEQRDKRQKRRALRAWRYHATRLAKLKALFAWNARRAKGAVWTRWRLETAQGKATRLGAAVYSAFGVLERLVIARAVRVWKMSADVGRTLTTALNRWILRAQREVWSTWRDKIERSRALESQQLRDRAVALASASKCVERAALSRATRTWRENGARLFKLAEVTSRSASRTKSFVWATWTRRVKLRKLGTAIVSATDRSERFTIAAQALRLWRKFSLARGRDLDRMRRLASLGTAIALSTDSFEITLLTRAVHSWRRYCIATDFDKARKLRSLGTAVAASSKSFERLLLARAVDTWRKRAFELTELHRERRLSNLGTVIAVSTETLESGILARALRTWRDSVVELNRRERQRKLSALGKAIAASTNSLELLRRTRAFGAWRDCAVELSRQDRERRLSSLGTVIATTTNTLERILLVRAMRSWRDRTVELAKLDRDLRLASLGTVVAATTTSLKCRQLARALRSWQNSAVELSRRERERRLSNLGAVVAASTTSLEGKLLARALRAWRGTAVELSRQDRERRLASLGTVIATSTSSLERIFTVRAMHSWRDRTIELAKIDKERKLASLGTVVAATTTSLEGRLLARALHSWRDSAVELSRQDRMRRLSSLGLVIATSTDSFQRVLLTRAIHSWRNRAIELTKQDRERRLLTLGVVIAVSTGSWEGLMRARALRIWRDRAVELNRQDEERKLEKLSIFVATLGNSLESAMRTRAFRAWRECAVEMSRQDRERRLFTLGTVIAASTRSTEKLRLSRAVRTWRDRAVELERQRRQRRLAILGTAIAACTGSLEDYQLSLALSTWRHVAEEDKLDRERRLSSLGTAIAASTGSLEHNLRMWALRIWRDAVEWSKQERERRLAMLGTAIALATGSVEDLLRSRALCTWRDAVERSKVDRERRLSSLGTAIASSTSSIERLMLASALRTWRERASLMRRIAAMSLSRVRRTKASALKAWRLETARIRTARLGLAISSTTCKLEGLRVAHAFNLWRDCVDVFVDALEFEEPMSPDRFLVVIARGSEVGPQEKVVDVDDDSTQSPISPHRTAVVIARGTDVLTDAEVETSVVSPVYREMSQRDAECFTPTTISTTWLSRPPSQDVLEAHLQCEERVTAEDRLNLAGSILSLRHLRPAMRQWRDYAAAVEDLRSARVGALRSTVAPISNALEQRHALEQWRRLVSSPMEIGEPHFSVRSDATVSAPRSASSPKRVELNSEPSTPPGGLASSIIDLPRSASRADLSRRKERSMHRVPEGDVKDATRRAADGIRSYYSAESFFRKKAVDDDDDNNSYTEIEARDESLDDPDPQWVSMLEKIQALQRGVAARSSAKMVRAPFDDHDRVKNGVKLPVSWLAAPSLGSL